MKAAGGNAKDLKVVAYKGSADAITNCWAATSISSPPRPATSRRYVATGKLRIVAITADKRMPGQLADIPTWKEQGLNVVFGAWRAIFAPKGLTPSRSLTGKGAARRRPKRRSGRTTCRRTSGPTLSIAGDAFRKELDQDYAEMKAVLERYRSGEVSRA